MKIAMTARLLAERRRLLAHKDWTRQQLEAFQVEALGALRKHTYTRSPFYQQFHKGLYEASLHELPALSKEMLMEHFDELVTDRKIHLADVKSYAASQRAGEEFLGRYRVQSTSGTSGHQQLLHDLELCADASQQRRICVTKRLPANAFLNSSLLCDRSDVFAQNRLPPVRPPSSGAPAGENPVIRLR